MTNPYALAQLAADELREKSGFDSYDIAIVLGSGWREGAGAGRGLDSKRLISSTASSAC